MVDFASILNKRAEDIEAPVPIPVGPYLGVITGPAEFKSIGKNETPGAVLKVKLLQPLDGVDMAALAEAGGVPERPLNLTIWLSEEAEYRAKSFFTEDVGLDPTNKTMAQLFEELNGATVGVLIKHVPSADMKQVYSQIDRTFNPNT